MNKKINYLFIVIIFFTAGWSSIPKSDCPAEIKKDFPSTFDQVWEAVFEVVKNLRGTVIAKDKSSGLIVLYYNVCDSERNHELKQIYINVYIKSQSNANITSVYMFPKVKNGLYLKELDKYFFGEVGEILRR